METKWQYRVEQIDVIEELGSDAPKLNAGGDSGWEAFAVLPASEVGTAYVFWRRPTTAAPKEYR